jgi:hypothetical protein
MMTDQELPGAYQLDHYPPYISQRRYPVWMSESLGDLALSQYGLEAFLIPPQFDDSRIIPEIW